MIAIFYVLSGPFKIETLWSALSYLGAGAAALFLQMIAVCARVPPGSPDQTYALSSGTIQPEEMSHESREHYSRLRDGVLDWVELVPAVFAAGHLTRQYSQPSSVPPYVVQ